MVGIIDSMDMSLSKLQDIVKEGKTGMLQSIVLEMTEQLNNNKSFWYLQILASA